MKVAPYLFFNGQGRAAATAYAEIFGVTLPPFMTMRDAPPGMDIPAERLDWIMHCEIPVGETSLMLSDDFAANSPPMDGCSVQLNLPTAAMAKAAFDKLAAGGEIRMPWAATFWSAGFGTLTDRFGIRWMVGTDEPPKAA